MREIFISVDKKVQISRNEDEKIFFSDYSQ